LLRLLTAANGTSRTRANAVACPLPAKADIERGQAESQFGRRAVSLWQRQAKLPMVISIPLEILLCQRNGKFLAVMAKCASSTSVLAPNASERELCGDCLPTLKCADVICDFCGYLAQVKAATVNNIDIIPQTVLGAAWGPQKERMDAAIYFPLFLVLVSGRRHSIFYLSADLQKSQMFKARKPLSKRARRAGWRGFVYSLESVHDSFVRLQ
jgi:hypothetical protein